MPFVSSNKPKVYYEVHGQGEPLVLVRGLGRSIQHWIGYEKLLANYFQVICIELRGVGHAKEIPAGWKLTIYDLADDIQRVLQHLNIKQAHVMGVSLGGMVALAHGLKFPQQTASIIAINSSIAGSRTMRLTPDAILALLQAGIDKKSIQKNILKLLVSPNMSNENREKIASQYVKIENEVSVNIATILKQLLAAARFIAPKKLRKLEVPTLVIYGLDDKFVPFKNSIKIAKLIPHSKLTALEGAGHEATLDKPEEIRAILVSWINDGQFRRV